MRRFLLLAVVLLLVPAAAAWPASTAPGDGTLVVDNGSGLVVVHARGGIIGRFDSGSVTMDDLNPTDLHVPIVYGAVAIHDLGGGKTVYTGTNVRFRMIGGEYRVRVEATGIDISAVGRGTVTLDASGFTDFPGHFQLNGGPFQPLPGHLTTYTLGQASSGQPGR